MKNILRIIIPFLIISAASGCVREELMNDTSLVELTATMEYETKTSLSGLKDDGMYYPLWSAGDEIAVYVDGKSDPSKFVLESGAGMTKASFRGEEEGERYVALYPYGISGTMSDKTVSFTLPPTQKYAPDSFGQGAFPMIASEDEDGGLRFMNLCSVLKISLTTDAMIRSVTVKANDDDIFLSGPASVVTDDAQAALVMSEGGSNSVTLECNGLEIDGEEEFHIVIPAQTYKGGLTVEVDLYSETISRVIETDLVFNRSQIRTLRNVNLETDMDDEEKIIAAERNALIEFYELTGGDNWINNTNWCSDRPVSEWYGITCWDNRVKMLDLQENNLSGVIPKSISILDQLISLNLTSNGLSGEIPAAIGKLNELGFLSLSANRLSGSIAPVTDNLTGLTTLWLGDNSFKGEIPSSIYNLKNLESLVLSDCYFSGEIPEQIGTLTNLKTLDLGRNNLSGTIPESLMNLTGLEQLILCDNMLSGNIPDSFYEWDFWKSWWGYSVRNNLFKFRNMILPGPDAVVECLDGKIIDLKEEYPRNRYTILFGWDERFSEDMIRQMKSVYEKYRSKGIGIIGWSNALISSEERSLEYVRQEGIPWDNFCYDSNRDRNTFGGAYSYPYLDSYSLTVVDSTGRIVFSDMFDKGVYDRAGYFEELLAKNFSTESGDHYVSEDYSQDGTTCTLQTASVGNGINIVLLGDGYSDRQIADGTYAADMLYAYGSLFQEEPYKTFSHLFNVFYVNVVSATEGFDYGDTALSCGFGAGTHVFGNDALCFNYARKAVRAEDVDETLVIVVMNSDAYSGTCYFYEPSDRAKDYGSGAAVAYFPKGGDRQTFASLLHHEACGHGFAKLADEYYHEGTTISEAEVIYLQAFNALGWYMNVDTVSDPSKVRWAKFLSDERYSDQGLGIFEGGYVYQFGVYRPTENSIMRYNAGGFNAPSREAIYYRIHKLAYGDDWEYDYEKFVEYDAINRAAAAGGPQKRRSNYVEKQYEPLHPPVVVGKTWREAGNN